MPCLADTEDAALHILIANVLRTVHREILVS